MTKRFSVSASVFLSVALMLSSVPFGVEADEGERSGGGGEKNGGVGVYRRAEKEKENRARSDHRSTRELRDSGEIRTFLASVADEDFVADEIIVKKKGDAHERRVGVARGKVREAVVAALADAGVEYAEPNYIAHAFAAPNDPYYRYQWHLDNPVTGGIHTEAAWGVSTGAGVTVAVVDTGIAYENYQPRATERYYRAPDLAGTCFVPGYDFVNKDTHPNDDESHGTHVAGTIAQTTNNSLGVAGVAHKACLMPVKVLNKNGSGSYADIADGIRYAADNGAKVINLSLGGPFPSSTLESALVYAADKGVTIVAAAGNDGTGTVSYPAAYDAYVIAVGATRYDETRTSYSNYGAALDLVAPGGDVSVDQNGDGYTDGILQNTFNPNTKNTGSFGHWFFQGTSMSAPHVAGVAALVMSHGNAMTPADVRAALTETADDLGVAGRDDFYGFGLVNAGTALSWTAASTTPPPPPPPPSEIDLFSDSFEVSEWNGLWSEDSQNDWFRSNQRAVSGSRSAEVDGSASNASLASIPIVMQGKTNATITFSWYIESGLDLGEYLAFDVSRDNGATWTERARVRGDIDPENMWHSVSVTETGTSSPLRLRFRGTMSGSSEDANVDMVKVVGY